MTRRKVYSVYIVHENGKKTLLDRFTDKKRAELRRARYEHEDQYERAIGYHVPNTKYIVK